MTRPDRRTRTQLRPSYTRKHGINDPHLAKASHPVTHLWPNYTPKQKAESQVAESLPESTEPQSKPHGSPEGYVTRSGRISKPPERLIIK